MTRPASVAVFERVADLADRLQTALDRAVKAEAEVDRLSNRLAGAEERVVDLGALAMDLERQVAMWKARAQRVNSAGTSMISAERALAVFSGAVDDFKRVAAEGKPKGKGK